jgi:hypothetical protein
LRDVLIDDHWSGKLSWRDSSGRKRSGHRPDLVSYIDDKPIAIEVELASKSGKRLDAILGLHYEWIDSRKTCGVFYICSDAEGCRIERAGERAGLPTSGKRLRVDQLRRAQNEACAVVASVADGRHCS